MPRPAPRGRKPSSFPAAAPLLTLVASCGAANETVTLVFPSESAQAETAAMVVTVLEPLERIDGRAPTFVGCERIGSFSPVGRIPLGPGRAPSPAVTVLRTEEAPFPLDDGLEVGFDELAPRADNPWGVVAVAFEARGFARAPLSERGRSRRETATLLSGCYCLRTQAGRFPDVGEGLDATIRDACPLAGGRDGEPPRGRTVPLRPVVPPEFRLEPCSVSAAVAERTGAPYPGPSACLRTTRCEDTVGQLCFDCELDCSELDDRSGGAVLMRVVGASSPATPVEQVVLTDRWGQARPDLQVSGCEAGFEVEAALFGREDEAVRFRVDCVAPGSNWALWGQLALTGRVAALEGVSASDAAPPAVAVLTRDEELDTGRFSARLQTFGWRDGALQLESHTSTSFEQRTAHGLLAFRAAADSASADGPTLLAAAVATDGADASQLVRNVELHVFRVTSSGLVPVDGAPLAAPCDNCDCGGLEACEDDDECRGSDRCLGGRCRAVETRACLSAETCPAGAEQCVQRICVRAQTCADARSCPEGDACVEGRCAPREPCRCELVARGSERVVLRAADVDGDGWTDLAAGVSGQRTVTFHRASAAGADATSFVADACSCARLTPIASTFDLLEFGGDARTGTPPRSVDLATVGPDGAQLRYAESIPGGDERVTCGLASSLGERFEVRDVRAIAARCGAEDCPRQRDLIVLGRVDLPGALDVPIVRVVQGSADVATEDPALFDELERVAAYFISQRSGEDAARDPQSVEVGDFNGDGISDFAVLIRDLKEVRTWLGGGAGAFVESSRARYGEDVPECVASVEFAVVDFDRDGRDELALVCDPTTAPRLLVYGESAP